MRRLALPALMMAALAGCGEIPQPFRHEGPAPILTRPKMARGLTIRPVADTYPDMADLLVKALEPHEVPAVKRSGPAFGHVVEAVATPSGLQWVMTPPGGEPAPIHAHALPTDPRDRRRVADETASILVQRLTDPDALPPPGKTAVKRPTVKVVPVKGLPGDGDIALTAATRRSLERSGFQLSNDGEYIIEARTAVLPGRPGEELLSVTWLVKTSDGTELAAIRQEGTVAKGRLANPWGSLARDIAEGSAAGIIQVVATAYRKQ